MIHILEAGENAVMWHCMFVFNLSIWVGVCGMITLGASPGQMSVIQADAAAGEEVIIHRFGAKDVGMLMLLAFLTWREHLFWILFLSLV